MSSSGPEPVQVHLPKRRPSAVAGLLVATLLATAAPPPPASADELFTALASPLAGPGRPELSRKGRKRLGRAWDELERNDLDRADRYAMRAEPSPARRLALLQIQLIRGTEGVTAELERLTAEQPEYAAAWLSLSVAAELDRNEALTLAAARKGAALWPRARWQERADELYQRWVTDRIDSAEIRLTAADPEAALGLVDQALALDADRNDARLLRARALLDLARVDEAEAELVTLGSDPDALFLAGRIAEGRQDWQTAMELYDALPPDHPGRDEALARARRQWRMTNLPPYVHAALGSEALTRAELAVVLVALAPELETLEGGPVPLLTDIVEEPGHREILTVVRLHLLDIDPLEHRFAPDREASAAEVRQAVDGLCHLLGANAPVWCADDVLSSCTELSNPVRGEDVYTVVLSALEEDGP